MMRVEWRKQVAVLRPWTCATDGLPASFAANAPSRLAVERWVWMTSMPWVLIRRASRMTVSGSNLPWVLQVIASMPRLRGVVDERPPVRAEQLDVRAALRQLRAQVRDVDLGPADPGGRDRLQHPDLAHLRAPDARRARPILRIRSGPIAFHLTLTRGIS